MKRTLLSALFIAAVMQANAQVVTDTVTIGASYANQVWYSLANDNQGSAPKNNWDIAFDASSFGSGIMINSVIGTELWKYPSADLSGWAAVDTAGLSTWPTRWNSDTSWSYGAMGNYANPANSSDLDWGIYSTTTHVVTGDSLYIIKLANGEYKKLAIESLSANVYTFKYANLDGTSPQTATIDKSTYTGKNFGYYSLQTNAPLDREPLTANWDLVFTQHTAFIPTAYTVTGILSNKAVQVAKVSNLADKVTYTNYAAATFTPAINTIGYNWKTFTGGAYAIKDSTVYFVKPASGDIWKIIFTGFSSANGEYRFSKEKVYSVPPPPNGVADVNTAPISMALYPNPSNGSQVHVIYSLEAVNTPVILNVTDVTGRSVYNTALDNTNGLHQYQLPAQLHAGIYIVSVINGANRTQQKLIIQ